MITKFNIYESTTKQDPDLRIMTEYVKCIKTYKKFKKGSIYKIVKQMGDPQRAIEEFGIEYGMPLECLKSVYIRDDDAELRRFIVNDEYENFEWLETFDYFSDYFELMEESETSKKYNL